MVKLYVFGIHIEINIWNELFENSVIFKKWFEYSVEIVI